eukprot:2976872-Prymnesium_polylepis.1
MSAISRTSRLSFDAISVVPITTETGSAPTAAAVASPGVTAGSSASSQEAIAWSRCARICCSRTRFGGASPGSSSSSMS